MKSIIFIRSRLFLILLGSVFMFSCKSDKNEQKKEIETFEKNEEEIKREAILVVTDAMEFKTRDTFPSGWNTFKYRNNSNEVHFILLDKYPEGKGIENTRAEIIPVFQEGMDYIVEGKMEEAQNAFARLPDWFQQVEFTGGVGLVSPKTTVQSTLYLEPGTYIMECYVKMENGTFHSMQMSKQVEVVDKASKMNEPAADYTIQISAKEGIVFNDQVTSGEKTFRVKFGEQKVHEHYLQHDVNLVWLDEGQETSELEKWMNWSDPAGLRTPAPTGIKFLGGIQEMKAGGTGYFTVNLKPGKYALISEIPDPKGKGFYKEFIVK